MSEKNKHTGSSFQDYLTETQKDIQRPPEEFWLDLATRYGDPCDFISSKPHEHPSATNIHVIEHSAYQAALDLLHETEDKALAYKAERDVAWDEGRKTSERLQQMMDTGAEQIEQLTRELDEAIAELQKHKKTWRFRDTHEYTEELEKDLTETSAELTAEREKSQTLVEALEEVGDNLGDSERRDIPIIRKIISAALAEFEGEG